MAAKTYSEYIKYIKYQLGATKDNERSLEFLDEDLKEYLDIAFSEILPYVSVRSRFTIPWNNGFNGAIDLKEYKIRAKVVTAVRRGYPQGYLQGGTTLYGTWSSYSVTPDGAYPNIPIFTLGGSIYSCKGSIGSSDPWVTEKLIIKCINETSGDGHYLFDYDRQLLFINFNSATPNSVTVDLIPEFRSPEDLTDDYWVMIFQRYAAATVKRALSQYRGKYESVEGAPFKLDYNRLQTEADAEFNKLDAILEENLLNYRFE